MSVAAGATTPERTGLRILLVDDDPSMARLVQTILAAHGFGRATHVTTGDAALKAADAADVVLLDHQLPDRTGLEVLDALRGRATPPAVVLVTAHGNETLAARALREGADDYLAKDAAYADLLPLVLERVRRTRALRHALDAAERDLVRAERLAAIGQLTVTLHHEINNPLMAASAEVELLLQSTPDPKAREPLEAVKTSLDRIRDILRRIRDLRDTPSTEYLAGLRMLDVGTGASPRVVQRGTAVLAIPEPLARVAALLLRTAGFKVVQANREGLDASLRSPDVRLLLVAGGGVPGSDLAVSLPPAANRRYKALVLASAQAGSAAPGNADRVMMLPFDPATFVADILALLDAP